jgi:hypothetical protein
MMSGYEYWKRSFFLLDGTPKYYNHKTLPINVQCSSQAIICKTARDISTTADIPGGW